MNIVTFKATEILNWGYYGELETAQKTKNI